MQKKLITAVLACFTVFSMYATDFNIVQFGAVSDTTMLSTTAVQKAIDLCSQNGGGEVIVPTGSYKIGTLVLKSNVHLFLEQGATLYGSTDLKDYIPMKSDYVSLRTQTTTIQLIFAGKVQNVVIDGYGTIDGRGKGFKKMDLNDEGITRPHLIRFINSQNISLKNITLKNSGCWMQHYLACDHVHISGVKVLNRNNYNNDGLDLDGCHDVIVSDFFSDSDDDGITLKSTSPRLCENIAISNCVVSSHCNAIKLGTETNGGFKNITISNCVVKPSSVFTDHFYGRPTGISAISLEVVDGGRLENVNVSDIVIDGTEAPIFIRLGNRARAYRQGQTVENIGTIDGVHINNVSVVNAGQTGCSITGLPGHPVSNIFLNNISITQKGGCEKIAAPKDEKEKEYPEATMWGNLPATGFFIRHAKHVVFNQVDVKTQQKDKRPAFWYEDSEY